MPEQKSHGRSQAGVEFNDEVLERWLMRPRKASASQSCVTVRVAGNGLRSGRFISGAARAGASPGADKRAAQDETTASEIVREALRRYVKVTEQIELVSGRRPCDVSLAIEARLVR